MTTDETCLNDASDRALAKAAMLCQDRNVRFTEIRRRTLELLWQAGQPVSAYELIRRLEASLDRRLLPPTIYRALDFLLEQGLVVRIESRNAFMACTHPGEAHVCMLLLCSACDAATEITNPSIEERVAADAASLGFQMKRCVVELQGICARCQSTGAH